MHHEPVGEEERVVGPARAGECRLLAIVDALEETGELQHIFRHAFAPLATHPGAGERLAQLMGVLGEGVQSLVLAPELVRELAERLVAIMLERAHEVADLAELARHRHELLIDQALLAVELRSGPQPFLVEQRPVGVEQAREELARVGRFRPFEAAPALGRPHEHPARDASEQTRTDDAQNHCDHHGSTLTTRCDSHDDVVAVEVEEAEDVVAVVSSTGISPSPSTDAMTDRTGPRRSCS